MLNQDLSKVSQKENNAVRKRIARQYGWKQCSYINWRIQNGYYFYISYRPFENALLCVKPLYVDDMWWDMLQLTEMKLEPNSYRGTGKMSVTAPSIWEECVFEDEREYEKDAEKQWTAFFSAVEEIVLSFLAEHPKSDDFLPDDASNWDGFPLCGLLTMLHAGKYEEVLVKLSEYRRDGIGSGFLVITEDRRNWDAFFLISEKCKEQLRRMGRKEPDVLLSLNSPAKNVRFSSVSRINYSLLQKGDVIMTNPEPGFYGVAVVLSIGSIEGSEVWGDTSCHIAITPLLFRHEITLEDLNVEELRPTTFLRMFLLKTGELVPYRKELLVHIFDRRNEYPLRIVGNIDPSHIFPPEKLLWSPQGDRFLVHGPVGLYLGREVYIEWAIEHDPVFRKRYFNPPPPPK